MAHARRVPRVGLRLLLGMAVWSSLVAPPLTAAAPAFTLFESGQVRPLALAPDGPWLFAVNTPDNRLEVFHITDHGLTHRTSVPVGLEPVAVAARSATEVWVVNHLSDSVSVVALDEGGDTGRVVRTLLVGDEPRDLVFAGPGKRRTFITTAHRGQNVPYDPQLTTPGVGRADVWVFDADDLGATLGGTPLAILTLFTDTPRALAATPDGARVYAAGFHSGNRTTSLHRLLVLTGGGAPPPVTNFQDIPRPETGLIVQFDGTHWVDELDQIWDEQVKLSLPDKDVFTINAMANPLRLVAGPGAGGVFTGVGTILFNMVVNPANGKVYVSNLASRNHVRFEGPGTFADTTVRGHLAENRITVLDRAGGVTPRHLNKHIDYHACCAPIPNRENTTSVAFPLDMVVTRNGRRLYVAAFGTSEVAVYNTRALEDDTFVPDPATQIRVTGGGPSGLALDEARDRLYVLARFANAIAIIDTTSHTEIAQVPMHTPEPPSIINGRRFFYDASFTSSHGDTACASCHIFGDVDSLAWDLGNPDGTVLTNPGPFIGPTVVDPDFHPMKGPMVTQSLRGLANHGPMHWRGDRTGGNDAQSVQPDSGTFDEQAAFKQFHSAFTNLNGRAQPLSAAQMRALTHFVLQITYPPNPIRHLDNSLTRLQQIGFDGFFKGPGNLQVTNLVCNGCHVLDREGNPGARAPGFFGSDGRSNFDFGSRVVKVPHLRNQYQKVGKFGMAALPVFNVRPRNNEHMGEQIRGFGYLHDGSIDTIFRFLDATPFNDLPDNPGGFLLTEAGDVERLASEAYMLVFDTNLRPIVGQQITLTATNVAVASPRIALLLARADAGDCELIGKGQQHGDGPPREIGFLYRGGGHWQRDQSAAPLLADTALRQRVQHAGDELTYTCVPPGSGQRLGIDRDGDGVLDGDERAAGSDPADPTSTPQP